MTQSKTEKSVCAPHPRKSEGGVTLVELLVAATIILISVIAIIAVVRSGTDMQVRDQNRRHVRSMIMGILEESFNYNNFTGNAEDGNTQAYPVEINGITIEIMEPAVGAANEVLFVNAPAGLIDVPINSGSGAGLTGQMRIEVRRDPVRDPQNNSIIIPGNRTHLVTVEICWRETGDRLTDPQECVMLTKRLTDVLWK